MNRLHAAYRLLLYASVIVLLVTAAAWEVISPGPHAALAMKIHGAAAMLTLVLTGVVLAHHVPAGWASSKNRKSGALLIGALVWLALSGYLLYYSGSEALRWYASQSHLWVGLAACAVLGLHIGRSALT